MQWWIFFISKQFLYLIHTSKWKMNLEMCQINTRLVFNMFGHILKFSLNDFIYIRINNDVEVERQLVYKKMKPRSTLIIISFWNYFLKHETMKGGKQEIKGQRMILFFLQKNFWVGINGLIALNRKYRYSCSF